MVEKSPFGLRSKTGGVISAEEYRAFRFRKAARKERAENVDSTRRNGTGIARSADCASFTRRLKLIGDGIEFAGSLRGLPWQL